MNNFECTVTIADIYGAEWWERNKEELDREWEWEFGVVISQAIQVANPDMTAVMPCAFHGIRKPLIALHRRKPKPPTLREVYGVDEVTIPVGWEWTGEWRVPVKDDMIRYCGGPQAVNCGGLHEGIEYRLILRERPKKVWFKAEETERRPRSGDWIWQCGGWIQVNCDWNLSIRLCATRHEEVDQTVQVVTQAMVDRVVK